MRGEEESFRYGRGGEFLINQPKRRMRGGKVKDSMT